MSSSYRYHPPGEHFYFEYTPAPQPKPKSPATPELPKTGDSRRDAAKVAASQSSADKEVAASAEIDAQADSRQQAGSAGHSVDADAAEADVSINQGPPVVCGESMATTPALEALPTVTTVATNDEASPATRRPLTQEEIARALVYVECGYSVRGAAAELGRHHSTLLKHLRSDPALADALAAAREKARSAPLLAQIREASKTSWRAAAWLVKYLDARSGGGAQKTRRSRR